jgi:pyruvyltransferase
MDGNTINVRWSGPHKPNWGDELNKTLVKVISGKDPLYVNNPNIPHHLCVGSILKWAHKNTTVWGSGFISADDKILEQSDIRAVRGPLSREKLLNAGFECPEVYGDPALLYPRFYQPRKTKRRYKIGIIPHYIDEDNPWLKQFKKDPSVLIINILGKNVNKFVDDVNRCDLILSSSLHGIICGDAYGIPSYWIELSDKVIGNGFKFRDYFMSVNRPIVEPFRPNEHTKISNLPLYDYKINIDLKKLYDSCPFKR